MVLLWKIVLSAHDYLFEDLNGKMFHTFVLANLLLYDLVLVKSDYVVQLYIPCAKQEKNNQLVASKRVLKINLIDIHLLKVRITSAGILNICNLWILLRKIIIYLVGQK